MEPIVLPISYPDSSSKLFCHLLGENQSTGKYIGCFPAHCELVIVFMCLWASGFPSVKWLLLFFDGFLSWVFCYYCFIYVAYVGLIYLTFVLQILLTAHSLSSDLAYCLLGWILNIYIGNCFFISLGFLSFLSCLRSLPQYSCHCHKFQRHKTFSWVFFYIAIGTFLSSNM
jgi:hypothetical protein